MKILVINCGSSSLKFQLIDSETEAVIAKGLCERIGMDGSRLIYTPAGGEKQVTASPMEDHKRRVSLVIGALTDEKTGGYFMIRYIGKRLIMMVPVILAVTFLIFFCNIWHREIRLNFSSASTHPRRRRRRGGKNST